MEAIEDSILQADELMAGILDPAHNRNHMREVLRIAEKICEAISDADCDVVRVAVAWHDVGRLNGEEGHEKISAKMARQDLLERGASPQFAERVYAAVIHHGVDMKPSTLEGDIVRDADKLDYLGVHKWVDPVKSKIRNEIPSLKDRHKLIERIPIMREGLLALDASKKMYDEMLPGFMHGMQRLADTAGERVPEIKSFYEELVSKMPDGRF
ncbi:MAG: HD domain-containing protein [Candidatus Altiarchaeota archaeon]